MSQVAPAAFAAEILALPLAALLPTRQLTEQNRRALKFRQIVSSIREIGIIEPLIVAPLSGRETPGRYLLLDGNARLAALRELKHLEAPCLVASEEEAFTYNKRVNRLSTIQEYAMITRAIARGVPAERIARALNLTLRAIERRQHMLDGIAPEVVELLKNRSVGTSLFEVLRRMTARRQVEAVELMLAADNFTDAYARALVVASRPEDLIRPVRRRPKGLSAADMARMEAELTRVQTDLRRIEQSYADDVMALTLSQAWLRRLLDCPAVADWLGRVKPDLCAGLQMMTRYHSVDH
ncbi:MAG: ParB N-terminal domain-containing protein [Alphaproteobacteria bacterium]|nr:ParB N-terminal domain-containing protein [Alphaproteobacteria bacterium]